MGAPPPQRRQCGRVVLSAPNAPHSPGGGGNNGVLCAPPGVGRKGELRRGEGQCGGVKYGGFNGGIVMLWGLQWGFAVGGSQLGGGCSGRVAIWGGLKRLGGLQWGALVRGCNGGVAMGGCSEGIQWGLMGSLMGGLSSGGVQWEWEGGVIGGA